MKKLLYILPLIGLLFFISCDKDQSNEIIDETLSLDEGQIEIIEDGDNKAFTAVLTPGIYGPSDIDALTSVKYYYIPTQQALNAIPKDNRRFRLYISIEDQSQLDGWGSIAQFNLSANVVTLKFPLNNWGQYLLLGRIKEWKLRYEIYDSSNGQNYFYEEKIINVNHSED
ncbi:hypothetical protein [uncultured Aquimarina sp.]|uniref:hypothetical protein n=1 Tax=uncultured Aquimarina sp. TaxID=575652 RepID=UPI0026064EED|nr:hypothetical protein [uncultured Aquimarina sp.]